MGEQAAPHPDLAQEVGAAGAVLQGQIGCDGTGLRHNDCNWCGGTGSREAYLDQEWYEALEQVAEEHGLAIESGDGDRNKRTVYEVSRSCGCPHGSVVCCRWPQMTPPKTISHSGAFTIRPGVFDYVPEPSPSAVEWDMNFADPSLFVAYDSPLLAQDELQVAEHPVLGSLRDALVASGKKPRTVDGARRPTPITITGVQRRCWIDTLPNPEQGRPHGLYGNRFARAPVEHVRAATKAICPPTVSNILAIAAPAYGHGAYSRQQITDVLATAYSGFSAARIESERLKGEGLRVVVHTGFWGCGAFGGNRTLMTILQALAADLANVQCRFHAFDAAGVAVAESAHKQYTLLLSQTSSTNKILDALVGCRFAWGQSDGN